jgi:hypothetical protein
MKTNKTIYAKKNNADIELARSTSSVVQFYHGQKNGNVYSKCAIYFTYMWW